MVVSSLGASGGAPLLHSVSLALDAIVAFSTWGASIFAPAPALCGVHQNKIMMIINIIIVAVDVIIIIVVAFRTWWASIFAPDAPVWPS